MLVLFSGTCVAKMCKWEDANGVTHYAETCPEGVEGSKIDIRTSSPPVQMDETITKSADEQLQPREPEKVSSESIESSTQKIYKMRERCIEARLSLDALSQKLPVYYDSLGKIQAELWNYPHVRLERGSRYLDANAKNRAYKHWSLVRQDNCTPAVSGSGIKADIRRKQKEHQQRLCEVWKIELEYMERSKSFHKERLDLKKLFSSKCK